MHNLMYKLLLRQVLPEKEMHSTMRQKKKTFSIRVEDVKDERYIEKLFKFQKL